MWCKPGLKSHIDVSCVVAILPDSFLESLNLDFGVAYGIGTLDECWEDVTHLQVYISMCDLPDYKDIVDIVVQSCTQYLLRNLSMIGTNGGSMAALSFCWWNLTLDEVDWHQNLLELIYGSVIDAVAAECSLLLSIAELIKMSVFCTLMLCSFECMHWNFVAQSPILDLSKNVYFIFHSK
jgi:hypothetical protein